MSTSSSPIHVVTLSGTLHTPSKTDILLARIVSAIEERVAVSVHTIRVLDYGHELIDALGGNVSERLGDEFTRVAEADLIVVATPVYKASYTGLLKLFIDFLGQDALAGSKVLLAAVGGNTQHSLVIDHELRPLFGFFHAHTLPAGVYAQNGDFGPDSVSGELAGAIDAAVGTAVALTRSGSD